MSRQSEQFLRGVNNGPLIVDLPVFTSGGFKRGISLSFRVDTGARWTMIPKELADLYQIPYPPGDGDTATDAQGNRARGNRGRVRVEILGEALDVPCFFLSHPKEPSRDNKKRFRRNALLGRDRILDEFSLSVKARQFWISRLTITESATSFLVGKISDWFRRR